MQGDTMVVRDTKQNFVPRTKKNSLKVKAHVDYVNHYFLKKHLHALTKMTNVLRKLEPNII